VTLVDPGNLTDAERAKRGIERYPTSQIEAMEALEQDELLMEALGETLSHAYLAVKRSEYAAFAAEDVDFEIKHHLYKF
jgi:glutamine synthetase